MRISTGTTILPRRLSLSEGGCFRGLFFVMNGGNMNNNKMSPFVKCAVTAVCMALCVVLPIALHAIPNAGTLISPMHLPVLLCGMICGWHYGLACGLMGPMLSCFITGMPGIGYLPTMMVELAVYGLVVGLMIRFVHTGKQIVDIYVSLIAAMLSGRIITGVVRALIFSAGSYSWKAWATGYFVSSFPGIILQLILIPILYLALQKAHLAPSHSTKAPAK